MLNWFKSPEDKWNKWLPLLSHPTKMHVLDYNRHQFRQVNQVIHLERKGEKDQVIDIVAKDKSIIFQGHEANFHYISKDWQNDVSKLIEAHIQSQIKLFTAHVKSNPPAKGDAQREHKANEWLKASLLVLERSIESLTKDQTIQTTIFMGKINDCFEIRIIIFNLDLSFIYDDKLQGLLVKCFNKKDQNDFDYSKPDLQDVFQVNAYPVVDRAIKLLQLISVRILKEI